MTPQISVFTGTRKKPKASAQPKVLQKWHDLRPLTQKLGRRRVIVRANQDSDVAEPDMFLDGLLFDMDAVEDQRLVDQTNTGVRAVGAPAFQRPGRMKPKHAAGQFDQDASAEVALMIVIPSAPRPSPIGSPQCGALQVGEDLAFADTP